MAYPNQRNQETEQAPDSLTRYNAGGSRSIWRPGRGFVKQIGTPPRSAQPQPVQWDAMPKPTAPVIPPAPNIDPGMTPGVNPSIGETTKLPAPAPNPYPFTTPNVQPAPLPATGGALSTPGAIGAQGKTDTGAWNHLFPNAPGTAKPIAWNAGNRPATSYPAPAPQAPQASAAPNPQYLTPGTQAPKIHAAAQVSPSWQQDIIAAHPNIGVAGTPENQAFVSAFNTHGAPERGMQTAQEVMKQFAPKANPTPGLAKDDLRGNPDLTPGIRNEARRIDPYALN
jgi:hypothetical protein